MADEMEKATHIESGGRYWVVPGTFLAGPYPVSAGETTNQQTIGILIQNGVRHFVDLTQKKESAPSYTDMINWLSASINAYVSHTRFPIPDMDVPTQARMKKILDHIDACLAQEEILYLHCMGGLGRTGTVVGCYLVRHGMSGEEALHRLESLRRSTDNYWKTSPETEAQRQLILDWSE